MDPELAAILAELPLTPIADASELAMRRELSAQMGPVMVEATIAAMGGPEQFAQLKIEDTTIPGPGGDVPVRIYTPTGAVGTLPGLVFLHGGGFMLGDLGTDHAWCLLYAAKANCIVVSVDYRLAPEHPYPAALDDGFAALHWVAHHAPTIGIDATRLAVGGESAGACLAAGLALRARDEGGPDLVFQLLAYAVLDDRMQTASMDSPSSIWDRGSCVLMWESYLPNRGDDAPGYAAPNRVADVSNLPPAYVLSAGLDVFRDEDNEYALRLMRAGVPVELHQVPGVTHGFDILGVSTEVGLNSFLQQANALRRAFYLPPVEA